MQKNQSKRTYNKMLNLDFTIVSLQAFQDDYKSDREPIYSL